MHEHAHTPRHRVHPGMLSVEEAYERIMAHFAPLEAEERPITEALGQTLAEDVPSPLDVPPLPNSAMDGYAVRYDDVAGATPESPVRLKVVGMVSAGRLPDREVVPGTAIRIMTGAPIPPGADTVVPFEDTDEVERKQKGLPLDEISILYPGERGDHVRPAGEDIRRGQVVLKKGTVLNPAEIGVLATVGRDRVRVIRRPVVAILSTGDELLPPGAPHQPGKIYDSNTYTTASLVQRYGGVPLILGIVPDDLEEMQRRVQEGLRSADLFITTAGVSKGDYDIVKDVLMQLGEIGFWSVRMRPAKPLAFGLLKGPDGRQVPHLGLPGNPVSTYVAFEVFARPAILKMLGRTRLRKPTVTAVLEGRIRNTDGRRVFARVWVERRNGVYYARPTGPQGSNILTSVARANGLAICPEDVPERRPGDTVQVMMLHWNEEVEV